MSLVLAYPVFEEGSFGDKAESFKSLHTLETENPYPFYEDAESEKPRGKTVRVLPTMAR